MIEQALIKSVHETALTDEQVERIAEDSVRAALRDARVVRAIEYALARARAAK